MLKRGIPTTRISSFDTRLATAVTGPIIAHQLRNCIAENPGKKLIVFGHSKGSLDVLEALRVDPALVPHVHRLVSVQSPFAGSPYAVRSFFTSKPNRADWRSNAFVLYAESSKQGAFLQSNNFVKQVIDGAVIQWIAGDYSGVQCLTYEARQQWFATNPLSALPVPVLCFASSALPEGLLFEDLSRYMRDTFGIDNDGLVAVTDAILPGSPFVLADGVSHMAPVFNETLNCLVLPSHAIEALAYMAASPVGI